MTLARNLKLHIWDKRIKKIIWKEWKQVTFHVGIVKMDEGNGKMAKTITQMDILKFIDTGLNEICFLEKRFLVSARIRFITSPWTHILLGIQFDETSQGFYLGHHQLHLVLSECTCQWKSCCMVVMHQNLTISTATTP